MSRIRVPVDDEIRCTGAGRKQLPLCLESAFAQCQINFSCIRFCSTVERLPPSSPLRLHPQPFSHELFLIFDEPILSTKLVFIFHELFFTAPWLVPILSWFWAPMGLVREQVIIIVDRTLRDPKRLG